MASGDEASLDPSNVVGRIYVGNHYALLHDTKYRSCGPHGLRRRFFNVITRLYNTRLIYIFLVNFGMERIGPD